MAETDVTLRQTMVEAASACNEAMPPRIRSRGGVCSVSMEVSNDPAADKLRVLLTLEDGEHHTVEVTHANELDLIRYPVECMGLLECWFDAYYPDPKGRSLGYGAPGVRLKGVA